MVHAFSAFFSSDDDQEGIEKTTTPGDNESIRWKVVARTPGLTPAVIVAGRLHAEGIPARAWQEGAGQALGLTVGLLGNGHVAVPEEYEEQALTILEVVEDVDEYEWDEEE